MLTFHNFPPQAARHVHEFVGAFAPALPPDGWERLVSEIQNWPTPIDRFADEDIQKFLDAMPFFARCEAHIIAGFNGWSIPECDNRAVVGDPDAVADFCAECWKKFKRGEFDGR